MSRNFPETSTNLLNSILPLLRALLVEEAEDLPVPRLVLEVDQVREDPRLDRHSEHEDHEPLNGVHGQIVHDPVEDGPVDVADLHSDEVVADDPDVREAQHLEALDDVRVVLHVAVVVDRTLPKGFDGPLTC